MSATNINTQYNNLLSRFDFSTGTLNEFIRTYKDNRLINYTNDFFLKSFKIFFLRFSNYTPDINFANGLLKANSVNCKFTIANIDSEPSFIKVVDSYSSSDLILYDSVSGYIFNKIISSELSTYKSCVVEYKHSFLSYYYNNIWNYSDLILYDDAHNSVEYRYNYNNIKNNESIYNASYIYISNVVKGNAVSYGDIIERYITILDREKLIHILTIIASMAIVYDFLELIGIKYGYVHNDLHPGNILFDDVNNRLVIIDYGKNAFQFFSDNDDDELNTFINNEVYKLDLNSKFSNDTDLTYKKIIESDNFRYKVPSYKVDNKYLGITFDIITLSLNIYKLIYNINNQLEGKNSGILHIITIFETLIKFKHCKIKLAINYISIDELISIYEQGRQKLQSGKIITTLNTCLYIFDGLLLLALLLKHRNLNEIDLLSQNAIIYKGGFQIHRLNTDELNNYLMFLKTTFDSHKDNLTNCIIFRKLASSGGLSIIKSTSKTLKSYRDGKVIPSIKSTLFKSQMYNPIRIITEIKEKLGYKQIEEPKTVGENYINLYEYITSNKLSIDYAKQKSTDKLSIKSANKLFLQSL